MTYVKVNDTMYPAEIRGKMTDYDWGGRASKSIRLTMTAAAAAEIFVDDVQWSIVEEFAGDDGETHQAEFDNSDFCVAGDITDHRNGQVTVKMGKVTDSELLAIMTGGN